ncbi:SMI1/KNR4 family protein [Nocardia tengchongensis]|uniref:SMI1/KNR4 family protein n=1 Tax=Nocardia tengchongensis TaxID=2055889 RepID=UPI0036A1D466
MTSRSTFAAIEKMVPPAPFPVSPFPFWRQIEDALGYRLPNDYRKFIDIYGDGSFAGDFSIRYPVRHFNGETLVNLTSIRPSEVWIDESSIDQPEGTLILWGGNGSGNFCYWFVDDETCGDPDSWPVYVFSRDPIGEEHWNRFYGSMSEFLVAVLRGEYQYTKFYYTNLPVRWHLEGDYENDFGIPPGARFAGVGDAVQWFSDGALIPVKFEEAWGGDQEFFLRTGKLRTLIDLERGADSGDSILLEGGILSPGMAYSVHGTVEIVIEDPMRRVGVQLVCDGSKIAEFTLPSDDRMRIFERGGANWVPLQIESEVIVPARKSVKMDLRIVSEPASPVMIGAVELRITGVVGD